MENKLKYFTTALFAVILISGVVSYNPVINSNDDFEDENFFVFFQDFCSIRTFQRDRTVFPLKDVYLSEDLNDVEESLITKDEWAFVRIKKFTTNTVEQYFNDFDQKKMEDSDEMVYQIGGIENGIFIRYFFSRKKGKWYLVKMQDLTT